MPDWGNGIAMLRIVIHVLLRVEGRQENKNSVEMS